MAFLLPSPSTIKLYLVIAMALMLSCATAPGIRTTDVAELHYGDREEDVVEKLGQGNELIYFILGGKQYSYRLYTTIYIHDVYALLFMKGELIAVHNKQVNFSKCLSIKRSPAWEQCLRELLSEMSFSEIRLDRYDFSEDIQAESSEQTERDVSRATTAAIAITLSIPYPGFIPTACIFTCGGCFVDPGAQSGDYQNPCIDEFTSIFTQAEDIVTDNQMLESIKSRFSQITSHKHVVSKDVVEERNDNSSILYYSWRCTQDTRDLFDYMSVLIGSTNGKVQWVWFRYEHLPEYESHEYQSRQLLKKASQGDPDAQWELYKKLPTEENLVWLCRAAEQDNKYAQDELGMLSFDGSDKYKNVHVSPDLPRACAWFHLAGRVNIIDPPDSYDAQTMVRTYDSAEVERTVKAMSEKQVAEAKLLVTHWKPGQCERDFRHFLGDAYAKDSALGKLCAAADLEDFTSREDLGRMYFFGSRGVPEDLPRAYMWYKLAENVYVPPAGGGMQSACDAMTPEQRFTAIRHLDERKLGECEKNLLH
jgi:TPR repeat protein